MTEVPTVLTNHPVKMSVASRTQIWYMSGPASVSQWDSDTQTERRLCFDEMDMIFENRVFKRVIVSNGSKLVLYEVCSLSGDLLNPKSLSGAFPNFYISRQ